MITYDHHISTYMILINDDHLCSMPSFSKAYGPSVVKGKSALGKYRRRQVQSECVASTQAMFMGWWREARTSALQPRAASLPTASERIQALRDRVQARGIVLTPT